jgi:enoyl reductase-like protein
VAAFAAGSPACGSGATPAAARAAAAAAAAAVGDERDLSGVGEAAPAMSDSQIMKVAEELQPLLFKFRDWLAPETLCK